MFICCPFTNADAGGTLIDEAGCHDDRFEVPTTGDTPCNEEGALSCNGETPIDEPRSGASPFFASTSLYFGFEGRCERRHHQKATAPIKPTTLSATATPMPAPAAVEIPLEVVAGVAVAVLVPPLTAAIPATPALKAVSVVGCVVDVADVPVLDERVADFVLTATFCVR